MFAFDKPKHVIVFALVTAMLVCGLAIVMGAASGVQLSAQAPVAQSRHLLPA